MSNFIYKIYSGSNKLSFDFYNGIHFTNKHKPYTIHLEPISVTFINCKFDGGYITPKRCLFINCIFESESVINNDCTLIKCLVNKDCSILSSVLISSDTILDSEIVYSGKSPTIFKI